MWGLCDDFVNLFGRHGEVDPCDFASVGHDRLDGTVSEREDAADDLLFDLLNRPVFGSLLDDGSDFGFGDLASGLPESQDSGNGSGAFGEEPDEGRGDCGAFCGVHADAFGDEFAEDDGQVGDDDDDGDLCDDGCRPDGYSEGGEAGSEPGGEGISGVDTGKDSDQGDSDLHGG